MAPRELPLPGTRPTETEETVDTTIVREKSPEVTAEIRRCGVPATEVTLIAMGRL